MAKIDRKACSSDTMATSLISNLLASERKPAQLDTFHVQYSFKDNNSAFPTDIVATNSTFGFVDAVATQYWKVKNAYPFPQGFAIFRSKQLGSSRFEPTEYNKVAIFPLEVMLSYFAEGPNLAAAMETKAAELYDIWRRKNAHLPAEARNPENLIYVLDAYSWPNENGVVEQSFCELELTNYWAAKESLLTEMDELTMDDVNVVMRIRSTLYDNATGGDETGKLYSKGMGYVVPIKHFVAMLRDPELKAFCESTRAVVAKVPPQQQQQQQQKKRGGKKQTVSASAKFYGRKPLPLTGVIPQGQVQADLTGITVPLPPGARIQFANGDTLKDYDGLNDWPMEQQQREKRPMDVDPSQDDGIKKSRIVGRDEIG